MSPKSPSPCSTWTRCWRRREPQHVDVAPPAEAVRRFGDRRLYQAAAELDAIVEPRRQQVGEQARPSFRAIACSCATRP